MAVLTPPERNSPYDRALAWLRSERVGNRLAIAVAVAAVLCGVATWVTVRPGFDSDGLNEQPGRLLLIADIVLALVLLAIVARRIVRLWAQRRRGAAGARLHTRIVALFSAVAIVPAIVMTVFAGIFFELGLQTWFSDRVRTAIGASVAVAESYVTEHTQSIRTDALEVAADINRNAFRLSRDRDLFHGMLSYQSRVRNLSDAVVFNRAGSILARSDLTMLFELDSAPVTALERAEAGEVVMLPSDEDRVRALVKLDSFLDTYLLIGRFVDRQVLDYVEQTRRAAREYARTEQARSRVEITFAVFFVMVAVLLLLAAVWFGIAIASSLVKPVGDLVAAAERVREGDLTARVPEGRVDDDMSLLGRSFNRMTAQLAAQRGELIEANRTLDERRRFTETVLAGVSAGVIGLEPDGRITLPNRSALDLLGGSVEELVGRDLALAVPEMADLFRDAQERPDREVVQGSVSVARQGRTRNLAVKISRERLGGDTIGFVVTFDDMTELVSAQRTAAWADVARRIAHEIKNPLTPIQLSAERLRRKYLKEIGSDREVFERCTDTIIRQVGDIGRMVDEFSAFARMPTPTFRDEDAVELVRQAVFLQQVAHPEIDWVLEGPPAAPLRCDSRQVAQALTNILKNAAEAIEGRADVAERGRVRVRIDAAGPLLRIMVLDNGRGLPREDRARLTEPYVTTRTKGTGLGLAIVKKIMEEHGGQLQLSDAAEQGGPERGACIALAFPATQPLAAPPVRTATG